MSAMNRRSATIGTLVVLAVIVLAVLLISSALLRGARLDLTENRLYTLSEGTRQIVANLDEPITLYYFFSDRVSADLAQGQQLRTYATRVRELLQELAGRAGGKIQLRVVDPLPFSEEEDRATAFGITPVPVGVAGENLYFGLAGSNSTDGTAVIPFFQMDKEAFLEYDVAKLIHELGQDSLPVVGLYTSLPMSGHFDPSMRALPQPWVVLEQLEQFVDLRHLEASDLRRIDEDMRVLVVVHPKDLDEDALYGLDQFVLRGGRLIAFVDPHAEADEAGADPDNPMAAMMADRSSDLGTLFQGWGIGYDRSQVVLDGRHAAQITVQPGQPPVRHLGILSLGEEALNDAEAITGALGSINLSAAGAISLADGSGLTLVPLLQSSGEAMLTPAEQLKFLHDPATLFNGFAPDGERHVLAGRLHGTFSSAFPGRDGEGHLAEGEGNIVIVADTDVLTDRLWVQVQNFLGQRLMNAFANNGDFFINAVDTMAGSSALIGIRGRATSARPFTTVQDIQRQAENTYRQTENQLQEELRETEQRLNELQASQGEGGALILSAEQRQELERFRARQLEIRGELRQVRRQLDADIDGLGSWLKFLNVWLLPVLLTLAVAGVVWWRRRRVQARAT